MASDDDLPNVPDTIGLKLDCGLIKSVISNPDCSDASVFAVSSNLPWLAKLTRARSILFALVSRTRSEASDAD